MDIEAKRENFNAAKLYGEARQHFERQLARLKRTNKQGGIGFFCDDPAIFLWVMQIVLRGGWVELDGDGELTVYDPEMNEVT